MHTTYFAQFPSSTFFVISHKIYLIYNIHHLIIIESSKLVISAHYIGNGKDNDEDEKKDHLLISDTSEIAN